MDTKRKKELKKQLMGVLYEISANADRIIENLENTKTLKIKIRMSAGEVPTYTESYLKLPTEKKMV